MGLPGYKECTCPTCDGKGTVLKWVKPKIPLYFYVKRVNGQWTYGTALDGKLLLIDLVKLERRDTPIRILAHA